MTYDGTAEQAATAIIRAFEQPAALPAPLAALFVGPGAAVPCHAWSWRNRLLVALAGHADARGFRQWQQASRWVKKGEKSFPILAPILRTVRDAATGERREVVVGFRGVSVFGLAQTDGPPLPAADPTTAQWLDALPLIGVARGWNLSVGVFDGWVSPARGVYRRGRGIELGVKNLATWAHELVHAADDRLGALVERGQHWRSETVAQLGAAVLLRLLGHDADADLGFTWHYIGGYAKAEGLDVASACGQVLDRTCRAVRHILDAAGYPADGSATEAGRLEAAG